MEKIKELGWKPVAAAGAVLGLLAGILGVAGVGAGALIVGILAAIVTFGGLFIVCGDSAGGNGGKGDKYKKLFMNLPIGFAQAKIIEDPVNGTSYQIVDANEIFGEYFKLDVSDYTGKNLKESKIEVLQDINAWFTAYNNSGTKEGDLMDVEITMESLQKVFNTVMYKSEADYINMVVIDITDQKDTENKLSKAIVDANAAYKTQAEFLANMSHEIRTPINGILGMLQLTLMADDLQADYRDNLVTAKNCADTLLRLINDILDISKLEAGKYKIKEETFDIKQAIEETVAAQVPLANNKGLQLDCSFGNNIPKLVKGDGQRIQQVLNCLLSNAIKFTSEGSVRVKIASMDMEGENKVKIRMAVADTGIGISEANMSKLFIRFSQVDSSDTRRYGGSGLGLVITKQIVELMGGNIQVQSKEDIGSTFIVEVPMKVVKASDDASVEIEQEEEPAVFSINAHSKARILVAEDEPVNQQVIGKLLGMAGFSYDIAENGQKAVELFKQKIYDAALFDVQMPVMDGIAATQEIREIEQKEKRKRLPIIAVTARAMFGDKERILENKLDDYIAKPYNLNDVVETLNKYIDD
ncbi:MAG: ATP-binding protein [Coprococcus sp.]|jgi:signal transduction histidine kinase/CheY-like chemotaxis protein|uniref:ATP-binding protein n=1 Tax=Coprococcus sp. TaxID=2049024 RepID=UPI002EA71515|nr:ATP-binding protein [Coprococcus sp.]